MSFFQTPETPIKAHEWMSRTLITVAPGTPILEAHRLMRQHRIRRLPVVEGGVLLGIVTLGDLLKAEPSTVPALSNYELPYLIGSLTVRRVMSAPVFTVNLETPVIEVAHLMLQKKIGGVPVMDGARVAGMLTESDLFRAFLKHARVVQPIAAQPVGAFMTRALVTVRPGATLSEMHRLMNTAHVRRLPVVDDSGVLVGLVTLHDVLEAEPSDATTLSILERIYMLGTVTASQIMTRTVHTLPPAASLRDAATLMFSHKIGGVPIVEHGKPIGIITESDVFKAMIGVLAPLPA